MGRAVCRAGVLSGFASSPSVLPSSPLLELPDLGQSVLCCLSREQVAN